MTPQEEALLSRAENFAKQNTSQGTGASGIPKAPQIEVTETTLDPEKFGLGLGGPEPTGDSGGGGFDDDDGNPEPPVPPAVVHEYAQVPGIMNGALGYLTVEIPIGGGWT